MKLRILYKLQSLTALVAIVFAVGAGAATPGPFVFAESSVTENLSQIVAKKVYQDSTGFIWILTQEGLNRYDGKLNKVFRSDANAPDTLSHNVIRGVAEDAQGNLWFGTDGGGLNRYVVERGVFEHIRQEVDTNTSLLTDRIWSVNLGLENKIWIGYKNGDFSVFNPEAGLFKHFTAHKWPELTNHSVTQIYEETSGDVWISTDGNGLLRYNFTTETLTRFGGVANAEIDLPSDHISSVVRDSKGNFWISTSNEGAVVTDSITGEMTTISVARLPFDGGESVIKGVHQVYEDQMGEVFLATNFGLGVYDPESSQIDLVSIEGLGADYPRVFSITQDLTGMYWLGSYRGVFSGFRASFHTVDANNGLGDENILSIAKSSEGTAWLGTSGGLYVMPPGKQPHDIGQDGIVQIGESPVMSLLAERDTLWIGTFDSGLKVLDIPTGVVEERRSIEGDPSTLSSDKVTSVFRDSFGNLWVGTYGGGVNLIRRTEDEFIRYKNSENDPTSLSSDMVYVVFQERNGDLWVGTESGLNRFNYDVGTFDRFIHDRERPGTLSSHTIYSIYEDSKARLWIGTQGGGLNMWEPVDRKSSIGKFQYFQSNIELPSSTVYAIRGDQQDNIWLATSGGITRYNHDKNEFKHFTVKDGLQANDFNLGASFRDRNGRIYFGGAHGLNAFYPDQVKDNTTEPTMAITRISLQNEQVWFDTPYDEVTELHLGPDDYMLGFEFAALDFNAPQKNNYRYQMVGLDKNWIDLANRNTIDFTSLPTGQYVFRVQGSNADGVWSDGGSGLNIIVHPPFYATWWAFFSYISTFLLVILVVIYRQRQREQAQLVYQSQLESDVRARTRDLRRANDKLQGAVEEIGLARHDAVEANQAKSEFLAALSHEIRTPMHGVLGMTDLLLHSGLSERQGGFAESAHESATELLGLIDNILDFSKIEAGKLELEETTFDLREVTENLCYLYGELAQTKDIELNIIFNADLRRQLYGDPVRLRQILQNLLSNAIKFTKRGSVTVSVDEVSRQGRDLRMKISVEDTGIGMSEEALNRIFEAFSQADSSTTRQYGGTGLGLSIAKQLVELMDGDLAVSSRSSVGTTMSIHLTLAESPIYTDKLSTSVLDDYYAEVVAQVPETRAMLRTQMEALSIHTRECASIEELTSHPEQKRVVLVDVGSLYDNASIAQLQNLSEDVNSTVLLVAPLSLQGIPPELERIAVTTKPTRVASLVNDILDAMSEGGEGHVLVESGVMRFEQRILLVEDMTANQEIARAMLESFGSTVDLAKNGAVALEKYQQETYDIILMDCQMPVMDGFEATRHIRQLESQQPGNLRMPIVALTAGKTETEKERCYASGMDKILFKPYSTVDLNNVMFQYFEPKGEVAAPKNIEILPDEGGGEILDMKALENIRSVDASGTNDLLIKVLEHFRLDVQVKLDELRENHDNPEFLGAGAHAIKSMSLNIGAKALSAYCRQREMDWKNQLVSDSRREIEVMHGHYLDALRALDQLVEPSADLID